MGGYHFLGNKDRTLFNVPLLVLAKLIKNFMGSAAESEVDALHINAQATLPIRTCLIEMGHPQPAAPLTTDNVTAKGILNGPNKVFAVHWEPGKRNLADYSTKHRPASHHRQIRPIYLYVPTESPKNIQGCVKTLNSDRRTDTKRLTYFRQLI